LSAPDTGEHPSNATAAIGLTVLAGLLYVLGYAMSRDLVTRHGLSPLQVTFLRCAIILAAGIALAAWPGSRVSPSRLLHPARAWEQRAAGRRIPRLPAPHPSSIRRALPARPGL